MLHWAYELKEVYSQSFLKEESLCKMSVTVSTPSFGLELFDRFKVVWLLCSVEGQTELYQFPYEVCHLQPHRSVSQLAKGKGHPHYSCLTLSLLGWAPSGWLLNSLFL